MNDQLEHDLATAFGEHAGGAVDTDVLAGAATRRGRRLRARTNAVRGAAAAVVVAVVTAGAVSVHRSPGLPQSGPATAPASAPTSDLDWTLHPPPGGWAVPRPPVVAAPADPSKVGTDPSLLHFTVDEWTVDATYTSWRSTAGIETIAFKRDAAVYQVSLTKTTASLDDMLERQPMKIGTTFERWQPTPDLWAQVYTEDAGSADFEQIKSRVRLDTTLRCAAPIQLSNLPAGARLLGCETTLTGKDLPGRLLFSTLWVGENTVDQAEILVTHRHPAPSPGTLSIGGRSARVYTDDRFRPSVEFPDVNGARIALAGTGTYKAPTLLQIAEGLQVAPDALNQTTWSARLVA